LGKECDMAAITYTDAAGCLRYSPGVKIVSWNQSDFFKHWRAGFANRRPDAKSIIQIKTGADEVTNVNTIICPDNRIRDVSDLLVADAAGFDTHEPGIPQQRRGRLCEVS
jgi:hypothetical protein